MTKKDYELVVAALVDVLASYPDVSASRVAGEQARAVWAAARGAVEAVGGRLADVFAADNPRFDRVRFLKAAGVDA